MPSKRRAGAPVSRDGISGSRGSCDQDLQLVEIDATLAKSLDLSEGQRVTTTIHVDPVEAHTINIEPLTPEDWEIIELHATFLEINLQSQIRALPNPTFKSKDDNPPHPLTLHLSPTSTASIRVTSLEPSPSTDVPFAKLSPNAEVIVAPKVRTRAAHSNGDHRSVASTSKSKRSAGSTVRRKSARDDQKPALFLRGVSRAACEEWFDDEQTSHDLSIWVDKDKLASGLFRGVDFATVDMLKPAGLQKPEPETGTPAPSVVSTSKIVAHLRPWEDPPNGQTAALSIPLCAALGCHGLVGGIVKLLPAPQPLGKAAIQQIKVFPFTSTTKSNEGLKFGGESKAEKEESAKRFRNIYSQHPGDVLHGPLTDGILLDRYESLEAPQGWEGGIVKFEIASDVVTQEPNKGTTHWLAGLDAKTSIDFQPAIPRPAPLNDGHAIDVMPSNDTLLVGIDKILQQLHGQLGHLSSVLLTGAMGSGKTAVSKSVARRLREDSLYHTLYYSCRNLVNDETRISTIKETLTRLFMSATWGARLGGKAIVVLDDLDRLCPAETELQVGNDNGRSRQISELICTIAKQYCTRDTGVVLLATAEGKDTLNGTIVSGHVVREIVDLKAPDKEARRRVMESITLVDAVMASEELQTTVSDGSRPATADGSVSVSGDESGAWMDGASQVSGGKKSLPKTGGFVIDSDLDFLDLAGSTDGYMPGDLSVLVSRARNEAMIRSLPTGGSETGNDNEPIRLARVDFDKALKGFTPASLRNVSLQSSTITFKSIGGLQETRRVLLETLEYPTKYAPIFAQCPLRLRSGLLLYGYPGCGKTLLASAVAGECGLNFISVKGPEILNKYIGASEKSVRDLFDRAQAAKPCVLFFDEFDSIAPKRGHDSTGVTDRVVNQLLTQMDGAEGLSGVYVLAATSRPDLIDPALLRPGRLDKSLLCDLPNSDDRHDILQALLHKVRLSDELLSSDQALMEMARRTEGFSGADLQALVSNAQLEAIHDVLDIHGPAENSRKPNGTSTTNGGRPSKAVPSFLQFRYGSEAEASQDVKPKSQAALNVENTAIVAKLEEIRLARKKSHQLQRGPRSGGMDLDGKKDQDTREVVVGWTHLIKALDNTRASISKEEKSRLQRIYHEFVVGRSGQMKDGQGSMEIGGRSSLM